jgi:hypothetical protein
MESSRSEKGEGPKGRWHNPRAAFEGGEDLFFSGVRALWLCQTLVKTRARLES